jgi:tetratricopeptide (TPR) repeat protein
MYEGRNDEALTLVTQIVNSSDGPSAEIVRLAQETSGVEILRPLSIALLRNLLARQSDNKPAALMLAHMLSWAEGTRPEAIQLYRKYLSQNDDAGIRADLAEVLSWGSDRRESLKLYATLLASSPGDRRLLMRMAQVLSWNGNLEKALKIYREILSKDPGNEEALLGTAQCQEWSGYNLAAEKILSSLASRQSNNPVNASSAAQFINKPEDPYSSRSFSVAIALERALNFRQMGRYDRAAQMLSQFYDLNTPLVREPREL